MEIRPAVIIRKETNKPLFIMEDPNVTWVRHSSTDKYVEMYCSVPVEWCSEIVAIAFTSEKDNTVTAIGIRVGNTGVSATELAFSTHGRTIKKQEELDDIMEQGEVIFNGSKYKLA